MRRVPLIAFSLVSLLPVAAAVIYAALYSVELTGLLADGFTLRHWSSVLASSAWWATAVHTVWIATAVLGVGALGGLVLAVASGSSLDRGLASRVAFVPLAVPPVVAALIVLSWFSGSGWIHRWLLAAGLWPSLEDAPSLVHDSLGGGIVLAHAYAATAFLALTFRSVHRTERVDELLEAAASLGAGPAQRLLRVALPIYLGRSVGPLVLVFVFTLGSYEIPLLLGQQSPQMLSVLVMRKYARFDLADKPEAMVIAVLYALAIGVLVFALARIRPRAEG